MKKVAAGIVVALVALVVVPPIAEAQERSTALTGRDASVLAKRAADGLDTTETLRGYASKCRRRDTARFVCSARWRTSSTRVTSSITISRTGDGPDYRDRYSIRTTERETECVRRCVSRRRAQGEFVMDTRRAVLGQPLTLLGQEGERLRVTPEGLVDVPPARFEEPRADVRVVGVVLSVVNVGERRADQAVRNAVRLVLGDGTAARSSYTSSPACSEPTSNVNFPLGELRRICVPFNVPVATPIAVVEVTLNSGYGPETGLWTIKP